MFVLETQDNKYLYIRGGGTGGPCPADDAWLYDADKNEWTRLPHCPSPRKYSAMALLPIIQDNNGKDVVRAVLYGGDEGGRSVITVTNVLLSKYSPLSYYGLQ